MTSLGYNPRHEAVLAGGCYSGQVVCWDTRSAPTLHSTSPPTPACPQDQPDDDSAPGGQSHGAGVLQQVDSLEDGDGDDDQQRGRRGQVVGRQEAGGSPRPARPGQHRPAALGAPGEAQP